MAHNRSPSKLRSDVLAAPLDVYRGWMLEVECEGSSCPVGRSHRIDALMKHYSGATVGAVLLRLKCVTCRREPAVVVLTEVRAARRVPLRGPECGY